MSEWKRCWLGELIKSHDADMQTGPFGTMLSAAEYSQYGTPVIAVQDIGENRLIHNKINYIDDDTVERLSRYKVLEGDIIFGRKGAVERRAIIKNSESGWIQGSDCIRLRFKPTVDSMFISYYIGSPYIREWLFQNAHGATMPSLNQDILSHMPLVLPPLPEQRAIAGVISPLDDKIDLLQRQNKTLEVMAETLFRQWFVEEADEGWESRKLGDICSLITDGKHGDCNDEHNSGYYFVSVKDISDGRINYREARQICKADFEETHRRTNFSSGDTLITNSGTIGRMAIAVDIPETRRTTFQKSVAILKPKNGVTSSYYLYCLLKSNIDSIIELAGGTTQSNLLLGDLRNFEIKYPDLILINQFEEQVKRLFDKMFANQKQVDTLEKLRDTLLPKLMSGEVRVKL